MTMMKYISWASNCDEGNLLAPTVDKQKTGWIVEKPPFEYMNWYMNRTDNRLTYLESPYEHTTIHIPASSTRTTIPTGEYSLVKNNNPMYYYPNTGQLKIYLQGILCTPGETYKECSEEDSDISNKIEWLEEIPNHMDILIVMPTKSDLYNTIPYTVGINKITVSQADTTINLDDQQKDNVLITCNCNFILSGIPMSSLEIYKKTNVIIQDDGTIHSNPYTIRLDNLNVPSGYSSPILELDNNYFYLLEVEHIAGKVVSKINKHLRRVS